MTGSSTGPNYRCRGSYHKKTVMYDLPPGTFALVKNGALCTYQKLHFHFKQAQPKMFHSPKVEWRKFPFI